MGLTLSVSERPPVIQSCLCNAILFPTFSRLERVLQSDEAKTFLGDVLAPVTSGNINDEATVGPRLQLTDDEGADGDLNVSGISESDVIASGDLSTGSHQSNADLNLPQGDILSPQHANEEYLTSSGESDMDRMVRFYY